MTKTLVRLVTLAALAGALTLGAAAQNAAAASPAPSASPAPAVGTLTEAGMVPAASPAPASGNPLMGTWTVERAVYELFGSLKDVTGVDARFYASLRLDPAGTGTIQYGGKGEAAAVEFEIRNGQQLTVAYGSRLKPQLDIYNLLILSDGTLYLRSTRLAGVNGTVVYLLKRSN